MTSRLNVLALFGTVLIAGCAQQKPIEDYSGPVAQFASTRTSRGSHGGDFFYLSSVNGQRPTMTATTPTGNQRGDLFTGVTFVPAKPGTYTIVGNTRYFLNISQLTNSIYRISGDISFTPEPNKIYVIKGQMNDQHSVIWIEDSDTGAVIDKKIEIVGSTAVGILEK